MTVGILIITHETIGDSLIKTINNTFGGPLSHIDNLCIPLNGSPEDYQDEALAKALKLDTGEGILLLGDLFGATPSNIAVRVTDVLEHAQLVCGINLPMLMRVVNYSDKSLSELADIAVKGGQSGITLYPDCHAAR